MSPSTAARPTLRAKGWPTRSATILSVAMMLRYSFDLDQESEEIENAVSKVLAAGYRTGDIMSPGKTQVGCQKMGDLIVEAL